MLALARRVHTWVLPSPVSVASTSRPVVVPIPTTRMAGVVVKSAATSCHVVSTNVPAHVTKAFVGLVKSVSMLAATVARSRRLCYVPIVVTRSQVTRSIAQKMARTLLKSGLACSLAPILAIAPSTAAFITARSLVILRTLTLVTAPVLRMLFLTVPAARPSCQKYHLMLALLVRTPSQTARSHA